MASHKHKQLTEKKKKKKNGNCLHLSFVKKVFPLLLSTFCLASLLQAKLPTLCYAQAVIRPTVFNDLNSSSAAAAVSQLQAAQLHQQQQQQQQQPQPQASTSSALTANSLQVSASLPGQGSQVGAASSAPIAASIVSSQQLTSTNNNNISNNINNNSNNQSLSSSSEHQNQQAHISFDGSPIKINPLKSRLCTSQLTGQRIDNAIGLQSSQIVDDESFSASTFSNEAVRPHMARLNLDTNGGAWCPLKPISANSFGKEWIQVKLNKSYTITAIETQGRNGLGAGREFVPFYQIEYSRNSGLTWHKWKDLRGSSLLRGNHDVNSITRNEFNPPIVGANVIRLLPSSQHLKTVCLRFELFGCQYDDGAPISYTTADGVVENRWGHLVDYTYDAFRSHGLLSGGLGQLVDGVRGADNFRYNLGFEWIGWKSMAGDVVIEFSFKTMRNFTNAALYSNNFFSAGVEVFQAIDVHYGIDQALLSDHLRDSCYEANRRSIRPTNPSEASEVDSLLLNAQQQQQQQQQTLWSPDVTSIEYEPDKKSEVSRPVKVHLKQRLANKLRFVLKFASKWILVSEVDFSSAPVDVLSTSAAQLPASQLQTMQLLETLNSAKSYDQYIAIVREHQLRRIAASAFFESQQNPASSSSSSSIESLADAPTTPSGKITGNNKDNSDNWQASSIDQTSMPTGTNFFPEIPDQRANPYDSRFDELSQTNNWHNNNNNNLLQHQQQQTQFAKQSHHQQQQLSSLSSSLILVSLLIVIVVCAALATPCLRLKLRQHAHKAHLPRHLAASKSFLASGTTSATNNLMNLMFAPTNIGANGNATSSSSSHSGVGINANGQSSPTNHSSSAATTEYGNLFANHTLAYNHHMTSQANNHNNLHHHHHFNHLHQSQATATSLRNPRPHNQHQHQLLVSIKDSHLQQPLVGGSLSSSSSSAASSKPQAVNTQLIVGLNHTNPLNQQIYGQYCGDQLANVNNQTNLRSYPQIQTHYSMNSNNGTLTTAGEYANPDQLHHQVSVNSSTLANHRQQQHHFSINSSASNAMPNKSVIIPTGNGNFRTVGRKTFGTTTTTNNQLPASSSITNTRQVNNQICTNNNNESINQHQHTYEPVFHEPELNLNQARTRQTDILLNQQHVRASSNQSFTVNQQKQQTTNATNSIPTSLSSTSSSSTNNNTTSHHHHYASAEQS